MFSVSCMLWYYWHLINFLYFCLFAGGIVRLIHLGLVCRTHYIYNYSNIWVKTVCCHLEQNGSINISQLPYGVFKHIDFSNIPKQQLWPDKWQIRIFCQSPYGYLRQPRSDEAFEFGQFNGYNKRKKLSQIRRTWSWTQCGGEDICKLFYRKWSGYELFAQHSKS